MQEGDEVAGFTVVDLPGHAPGQIGLWREVDRVALVSDCFYTLDPQTGRKGHPRVPHAAFNHDTEQARASIRKLAAMEPFAAWPGHADPLKGDVRAQLETPRPRPDRVGKRSRQRAREGRQAEPLPDAPTSDHVSGDGAQVLTLRGAMTAGTRVAYRRALAGEDRVAGGAQAREDAWQRAVELLFERLAVRWVVARRADGGPEGAAAALPRGHAATSGASSATRCARTWRSTSPSSPRRERAGASAGRTPRPSPGLLTGYCLDVEPGQHVVVRSTTLAAPLLLALQAAILDRDAWPLLRVELPGQGRVFYEHARDAPPRPGRRPRAAGGEEGRSMLGVQAPADPLELAGIDPERLARVNRARRYVRDQTMKRRWCSTLWPTPALAERAGMDEAAFGAFVASALFLDRPDPVLAWRQLAGFQDS